MFQLSKGDFLEPLLEFIIKVVFKAGAKHSHDSDQLDFWDFFLITFTLIVVCGLLYSLYKKKKQL
jgi:hypothetical protein